MSRMDDDFTAALFVLLDQHGCRTDPVSHMPVDDAVRKHVTNLVVAFRRDRQIRGIISILNENLSSLLVKELDELKGSHAVRLMLSALIAPGHGQTLYSVLKLLE